MYGHLVGRHIHGNLSWNELMEAVGVEVSRRNVDTSPTEVTDKLLSLTYHAHNN